MDRNQTKKSFADLFDPEAPPPARPGQNAPGPQSGPDETARLDLHGLTCREAEIRIEAFIQRCYGAGISRARIITGVGRHSANGPVLKQCAEKKLRRLQRSGLKAAVTWEGPAKTSAVLLVRFK